MHLEKKKARNFITESSSVIKFLNISVFKYSKPSVKMKNQITGKISFEKIFLLQKVGDNF